MERRPEHPPAEVVYAASKLGIWIFLATELILFGGLFAAYALFRTLYSEMFREQYKEMDKVLGAINTVILICSSLTMALGVSSIQRGKQRNLKVFLSLTILFALGFLVNKYFEYAAHFHHNIYPGTNLFFSLYFTMTGLHGLHVVGGIVVLAIMLVLSFQGRFSEGYYTPVEVSGIYWHFVDLIWIYLFPLLYLIR